ncbi:MAG: sulfurtransferase [Sarcina sp.]
MNNKVQKVTVAIVAVIVFLATFFGSTREQVVVEAKKIVTDSNNINNNYLIGIQSLENALGAQGLVILDIRSSKEYKQGHIPGAINVSWSQFVNKNINSNNSDTNNNSNNPTQGNSNDNSSNEVNSNDQEDINTNGNNNNSNQGLSSYTANWINSINKNTLTKELQNLGITNQSTVVIYGDSNGDDLGELGKFSWMFRMVGIQSKMLNGGYKNWVSQGFTTTTQVPKIEKSNIVIQNFVPIKTIKKSDIEKNISKIKILELINDVKNQNTNLQNEKTANVTNNTNIADAQSTGNNTKDATSIADSKGNNQNNVQVNTTQQDTQIDPPVKGVIQIKLSDMLNPNGTIKPVNQLQELFSSKGIQKNDIVLFYNTDKGNLAFLTLMLNMAGYDNIQTYNASLEQVANITTQILEQQKNNQNTNTNNGKLNAQSSINNITGNNQNTNVSNSNNNNNNSNSNISISNSNNSTNNSSANSQSSISNN